MSYDGAECRRIMDSELAEHLSVHLDAAGSQGVDQLGVFDIVLAASRRDAGNPKSAELALLRSAISEGVLPRFHHLLVSALEDVFLTAPITGGPVDDLLMSFVAH